MSYQSKFAINKAMSLMSLPCNSALLKCKVRYLQANVYVMEGFLSVSELMETC